jgi:hypothetical protein
MSEMPATKWPGAVSPAGSGLAGTAAPAPLLSGRQDVRRDRGCQGTGVIDKITGTVRGRPRCGADWMNLSGAMTSRSARYLRLMSRSAPLISESGSSLATAGVWAKVPGSTTKVRLRTEFAAAWAANPGAQIRFPADVAPRQVPEQLTYRNLVAPLCDTHRPASPPERP